MRAPNPAPSANGTTPSRLTLQPAAVPAVAAAADGALLARCAAGDSAALGTLYDHYGRQAFALAYRIVGSPEGAEEVVQESFLAVWRRADQYAPTRGPVRGWLLTIVRNRAFDQLRARQARPQPAASLDDVAPLLAGSHDTEALALAGIEATAVRAAVRDLTPLQRQTVELAYLAGLAYPEVAAQMGTSPNTVKSRLRLALTRLRLVLAPPPGFA